MAAWKEETQKEGRMSLIELMKRGMEIEEKYIRGDGHSTKGTRWKGDDV